MIQARPRLRTTFRLTLALVLTLGAVGISLATAQPAAGRSSSVSQAETTLPSPSKTTVPALARAINWESLAVLEDVDLNPPGTGIPLHAPAVAAAVLPTVAQAPGPVRVSVVDVASGAKLVTQSPQTPAIPASTLKLVTALSIGESMNPQDRLLTSTLLQGTGETPNLVLRGAGDSLLMSTQKSVGADGSRARTATTQELAARTARELTRSGVTRVQVSYDATLFTGPTVNPDWQSGFPASGIVAPVSALMVDQGRASPGSEARTADPALAAARTFARQLQEAGIKVTGDNPKAVKTAVDARLVASVSSPTIAEQVERMLATSDNDLAESLSHLAAHAVGLPANFTGGVERARQVLQEVGVDLTGLVLRDGSGLSRSNRLTATALTELLIAVARAGGPDADPSPYAASAIRTGLPVAGATGSLRYRFGAPADKAARGLVRAKTGTLTGVRTLAGYASRPDGRLVAFAFLSDDVASAPDTASKALDTGSAKIVTCQCQEAQQTPGTPTSPNGPGSSFPVQ